LLSATLIEGATTLPLCRDLWNAAVLIETEGEAPRPSAAPELSEINPESGLIGTESLTTVEADYFETLPGYESLREVSERYLSALSGFEGGRDQQVRAIAESILLPFAASIEDEEERRELLQHLAEVCGPAGLESQELEALVRRVRRRVA
jgi:hypothetical protein